MIRAFWTHNTDRNEKWFYDKSVWQKMLRAMSGCGFDSAIFADALLVTGPPEYRQMLHWVFEAALDYEIAPYVFVDVPGTPGDTDGFCARLREMVESYSELRGVVLSAKSQALVDAVDAARPDAAIYVRPATYRPETESSAVTRRGGRRIGYCVKYTGDHLVDANPDPSFTATVEQVGAENVLAEFCVSNFEPWTSFSYDTVEGTLANLAELGCDGFALHPLCAADWPHTSDTFFKYQWQRDLVWYSVWGGAGADQLVRQGHPKWLARNVRLVPGFEAGSRILELLSLYFAGDKSAAWRPQFCSIAGRLLTLEDMLHLETTSGFDALDWWTQVTGDRVVHLAEYITYGAPADAYGPEELIEELTDLSEQAVAAGEKGMRSASGEKELPGLARDAYCMGALGEFYVERLRAALAHARGDDAEAAQRLARALGLYREIAAVDSSHREPAYWSPVLKALEAEHADAAMGVFEANRPDAARYPISCKPV